MTRLRITPTVAVALAALVLAAAGGAYAAVHASSSTISACVHHKSGVFYRADTCHPRDAQLTWNVAGPPGPAGAQGPAGPQGVTGPRGDPGVTTGAQSGGNDPPALSGGPSASQTLTDTVLATSQPGSVFVVGHVELQVDCGPLLCSFAVGLYVDGLPVPGSARAVDLGVFDSSEESLELLAWRPAWQAFTTSRLDCARSSASRRSRSAARLTPRRSLWAAQQKAPHEEAASHSLEGSRVRGAGRGSVRRRLRRGVRLLRFNRGVCTPCRRRALPRGQVRKARRAAEVGDHRPAGP